MGDSGAFDTFGTGNQKTGSGTFGAFDTFGTEWEMPIPFDEISTPDFPVECLPKELAAFTECLSESTQTPLEMSGILSLGVLATAFQSKFTVEVTSDWQEPLCVFCVAVAPPGERKSAVLSALTKPIYEYESEQRELEAAEIFQNKTRRELLEKSLESAKKKGDLENALDLSAQLAEFKDMYPFRLLTDDVTPEKLIDLMEESGGSITICSAEGGLFSTLQGRYERNVNFDPYLKGHAGDPIVVDRIGRTANSIPDPRLTAMICIQPEVLSGLMGNTTFRGRGLCGRFLYGVCKTKVGSRKVNPAPVPDHVRAEYRAFVRRILSTQWSGTIRLSPEADLIRREYQQYIEEKLGNEWEHMRDWGGKLVGAACRIAGLLHAAEVDGDPTKTPINMETMISACRVAECLSGHAEAVYRGADEGSESARYLWRRISSTGRDELSKRDLFNISRGRFKRVDDMDPSLDILVSMGYIKIVEAATGGRPTKKLFVNPRAKYAKDAKAP